MPGDRNLKCQVAAVRTVEYRLRRIGAPSTLRRSDYVCAPLRLGFDKPAVAQPCHRAPGCSAADLEFRHQLGLRGNALVLGILTRLDTALQDLPDLNIRRLAGPWVDHLANVTSRLQRQTFW